jgi:MFS family permease
LPQTPTTVARTYYGLTAGNTFAASLIWGINTIFLLDAGLTNLEAFTANAFYTAGMVLFEIPTGIVADTWGRRASFLLGTLTLAITTALYVWLWQIQADFVWWAVVSALLGLGFTFFSGATEAWLVDALTATGFTGRLEDVFARGAVVNGTMMLLGSVAGGYLAQVTSLGVTYWVRAAVLIAVFVVAMIFMHDLGFTPGRGRGLRGELKHIVGESVDHGLKVAPIRATMLSGFFLGGVGMYVFYALQPHLLDLWGDPRAYGIAGLVAAVVAGAQIAGGLLTPVLSRLFRRRTSALIILGAAGVVMLVLIGLIGSFWLALVAIVLWALSDAAAEPVRRAYLNGMIPSPQRATILSFDSMLSSAGAVVGQPALSKSADVWGYPASYLFSAAGSALALPFLWRARQLADPADTEHTTAGASPSGDKDTD